MASPFEFAKKWGGPLRPIEFPIPKPLLPADTVSFLHNAGVPKTFELTTYQFTRFSFQPAAINLTGVWATEMPDYSLPARWAGLWLIGDITFTQASAWLCVEEVTGRVVAVDVDLDDPLYPVNGSVEAMVRCMKLVRDWARPARGSLKRAGSLEEAIAGDKILPAGEVAYFWQPLITEAIESGRDRLVVKWK